jgi:hypothetical protein
LSSAEAKYFMKWKGTTFYYVLFPDEKIEIVSWQIKMVDKPY